MMPPLMFSLGMGIILGIFNSINSDVANITKALLTYGMFISSVIFSMPTEGMLGLMRDINILGHFIIAIRGLLVKGHIENMFPFLVGVCLSLVIFALAVKWQHTLQFKIRNLL
jgi:ABC-type polysaccharide/polyol phosphate export permease